MNADARVMVVGSANMDLVFGCPRLPMPGETLLGGQFLTVPGGKGANQAVAVARLGGRVALVGKVGDDGNGSQLLESLRGNAVDVSMVGIEPGVPSGAAGIFVDADGQNCIVVVPGANALVTSDEVQAAMLSWQPSVVLAQLEIPVAAVAACAGSALFVLNPAPFVPVSEDLLAKVDVITPNETETEAMTGVAPLDDASCAAAARWFLDRGVKAVVLTLGGRGCYVHNSDMGKTLPVSTVNAVDTTAAGDAFSGALSLFLSEGKDVFDAAKLANCVGALATTKPGAQDSMPTLVELHRFLG